MGFIPPAGRLGGKREGPDQRGFYLPSRKLKKKGGVFFSPPHGLAGSTHECCAPLSYLSYSLPCLVLVLFPRGQFSHSGDTLLQSGLVFPLFPSVSPRTTWCPLFWLSGVPCSSTRGVPHPDALRHSGWISRYPPQGYPGQNNCTPVVETVSSSHQGLHQQGRHIPVTPMGRGSRACPHPVPATPSRGEG